MRPATIVNFERLIFATLVLGLGQTWLAWDSLRQMSSVMSIAATDIFTFGLIILLTLLVSRRRSKVATWISIAMFVLGLPVVALLLFKGLMVGSALISLVQTLGQIVAYGLLFTPSARRWLNKETTLDDLGETFA
jgi:ABC-type Mn2+/Zn2+ transport system permease subunit